MTTPLTISDLDPAGPLDPVNDLLLIRQGFNDRKITPSAVGNPHLASLSMLPGQLVASDVLLVGRNNGVGYDNYIVPPQNLGFLNGTSMWFFQANAPLGWTVVPNSGDKVLATALPSGAAYQYHATGYQGTWQQEGHALTIDEMPTHSHSVFADSGSGSSTVSFRRGNTFSGATNETTSKGGNQLHNHGNQWRPSAAVGILCTKNLLVGQ